MHLILPTLFFCFSDTTTVLQSFPLKDSITTWQFTGISLSQTNGEGSVASVKACAEGAVWMGLLIKTTPHLLFFLLFPSLFISLSSLRYLCWRTIRGNCPEGFLHWSQTALLSCPRRADRNQGNPPQLQPWFYHCKFGLFFYFILGQNL